MMRSCEKAHLEPSPVHPLPPGLATRIQALALALALAWAVLLVCHAWPCTLLILMWLPGVTGDLPRPCSLAWWSPDSG